MSGAARRLRAPAALVLVALCAMSWAAAERIATWRVASAAFPRSEGEIRIPDLRGRVALTRDGRGVPQIDAEHESDAWSALGFVHAQDRLAQMLWLRRLARGRTAEVVGEAGLRADRLVRTLGIGMHADAEVARLDAETLALLLAYASGVNARIERVRAGLVAPPVELGARADLDDPWVPGDSLALVKLMAWNAGPAPETTAVLWDLVDRLGAVAARPFFPTGVGVRGEDLATALPSPERSGAASGVESGTGGDAARGPLLSGSTGGSALRDVRLDSTAWLVSGRLTASGAPILGVDFHLPPTRPALVYQAGLSVLGDDPRGLEVSGVTVPGVPVFWAGRNRQLAWAVTPARIMTADLYRETENPDAPGEYRHGRSWRKASVREELIAIAGPDSTARSETLRVVETRHGPLINRLIGREGDPLALAWTGARPGNGVKGMIAVARSSDEAGLLAALHDHHEPTIALLYADRAGAAAGLRVAGWVPRHRVPTGLVPVPGRHTLFDWRGSLKPDQLPHRKLEDGDDWLVAADGPLVDELGGRIEWLWRTGEASTRIEAALADISQQTDGLSPADLSRLGPGPRPLGSPASVSAILALAGDRDTLTPEAKEVADLLADWDGSIRADSSAASAVHLVFHHLTRELLGGPVGPERLRNYLVLSHSRPRAMTERVVLAAVGSRAGAGWSEPERVRRAVRASLRAASLSLSLRFGPNPERWQWGQLAGAPPRPFAREGEFSGFGSHTRGAERGVAQPDAVATMNPSDPFEVETETSYRLVIDLATADRALAVSSLGQSEHPYHPHFGEASNSPIAERWESWFDDAPAAAWRLVDASVPRDRGSCEGSRSTGPGTLGCEDGSMPDDHQLTLLPAPVDEGAGQLALGLGAEAVEPTP